MSNNLPARPGNNQASRADNLRVRLKPALKVSDLRLSHSYSDSWILDSAFDRPAFVARPLYSRWTGVSVLCTISFNLWMLGGRMLATLHQNPVSLQWIFNN
jgi:hypothetical protein